MGNSRTRACEDKLTIKTEFLNSRRPSRAASKWLIRTIKVLAIKGCGWLVLEPPSQFLCTYADARCWAPKRDSKTRLQGLVRKSVQRGYTGRCIRGDAVSPY